MVPPGMPLPLQFSGRIEQTSAAIALPAFKLTLAGQAVAGQRRYEAGDDKAARRPRLTGAINADVLDLGALIPKTAAPPAPPTPITFIRANVSMAGSICGMC